MVHVLHLLFSYISRFRAPERISGEAAYFFTHLMAAIEFIEKMDRQALKIDEESYEKYMETAISDFNQHEHKLSESPESSESASFNEKLDLAEAKAEEFFSKAKEAFKVTGERANQAFYSFKESNLAKKSMEKFNNFLKDFKREAEEQTEDDFDLQLAKAISIIDLEDNKDKEESLAVSEVVDGEDEKLNEIGKDHEDK